jgi:hypothetical protein
MGESARAGRLIENTLAREKLIRALRGRGKFINFVTAVVRPIVAIRTYFHWKRVA